MKTYSTAAGAAAFMLLSAVAAAITWHVDPVHSVALFKVQHLGAGYTWGVFTDISGSVTFAEDKPEESSIEMVVKTDSLNTFNAARDKHLKNADFFEVETYPEMSFKSTAWKKIGEDTFEVAGDFSLHGVTKPITLTAVKTGNGKGRNGEALIGFEATFTVKRSEFGMGNMVPNIGDDVTITVAIEAIEE